MKKINVIRYTGNNHTTLVADKKHNAGTMPISIQATALSHEEAEAQLRLSLAEQFTTNDTVYTPESFELEFSDFTKFSKFTTDQLLKLYDKTEKMLGAHEMIEALLVKRGAIQISEPEEGDPVEEEKPVRTYKKCMTEECLQNRLAEARTNYRKFCKFLCTKDKEEHFGIIRSARLDKRSGFIQYRIEIIEAPSYNDPYEKTGKIYGKGDDSKDLTIYDNKPEFIDMVEPKAETNNEVNTEE